MKFNTSTDSAEVKGVPLLDLKAQYQAIKQEVDEAVAQVLASQYFILGPEVEALEMEIAAYCGCRHAVGVSSGTDALMVAMMAFGVQPGDEVITSPYTFFATAGAIHRLQALPVFVDIEPETYCLDPQLLEAAITPRSRFIIPVHLYGQTAEMEPILKIAEEKGVTVIEDACQAIGALYKDRSAGTLGAAGCFSFFPTKNLGGVGDGGMVITDDEEIAARLRRLRVHGSEARYYHREVGGNFRLDAMNAAVLRVKLKYLDSWIEARRRNAANYNRLFIEAGLAGDEISLPEEKQQRHIYHQYVVRALHRDELKAQLSQNNIGCEVYYPLPLHLQECFGYLGYHEGDMPESEAAAESTLALPIYPELTFSQQELVVETIRRFYR